MSDRKLLEQALESLQTILGYRQTFLDIHQVMEDLKTRLAQPEQESVAYKVTSKLGEYCGFKSSAVKKGDLVYTAPPQREWQGLTDDEYETIREANQFGKGSIRFQNIFKSIEAKLREKNSK